jgi:hypothetical protein
MAPLKQKKGFGFMTGLLSLNKRPETSTPHDPLHPEPMHVRPDLSTRKFIGLPEDWRRLLEDGGISKSDQEKTVMEIVKSYLEGGGDFWDRVEHAPAPGSARSPPNPGTEQASGVSKSIDDTFVPTVSTIVYGFPLPPTATQQPSATEASLAKKTGATLRRREKMQENKANDAGASSIGRDPLSRPDASKHLRPDAQPDTSGGGLVGEETGRPAHARYSFDGTGEGELQLFSGQELEILDDLDHSWWYARDVRTGNEGLVPSVYVY